MTTYYKAVRPDGTSFHDPSFAWATEPGGVTTHPSVGVNVDVVNCGASGYLSVSTVPTDCTGMRWPCRLLEVEPAKWDVFTPDAKGLPNKRAALAFRTVRELPAHEALGPNGEYLAELMERCSRLTPEDANRLAAAWAAARDAARALSIRDLIGGTFTQAHYDTLTMPWRTGVGPIHPDDAAVSR